MPDVATLAEILAHHLGDDAALLVREIGSDNVEVTEINDEANDLAGKGAAQ